MFSYNVWYNRSYIPEENNEGGYLDKNPGFSSEKRILSQKTAPSEAVKRCCLNKLNPF